MEHHEIKRSEDIEKKANEAVGVGNNRDTGLKKTVDIKRLRKIFTFGLLLVNMAFFTGGCSREMSDKIEKRDMDFTVLKEADIPKELKKQIEDSKESEFKLTYKNGEYLYIASGYGKKNTSGYSVAVEQLYETSDGIFYKTKLIGPGKDEQVNKVDTYPYIAIKTEITEGNVLFQ